MIDIKVIINKLAMPKPRKKPCPLKKLQHWMDTVETDKESWEELKEQDEVLGKKKKRTHKEDMILKKITPVIRKYAQYDNDGVELTTDHLSEG